MKRFSRARRALATLCFVLGIPGLASGHGDEPHGSHDASFGGLHMAALVGGSSAVIFKALPYNLGLVLAASLGIGAGMIAERFAEKKAR